MSKWPHFELHVPFSFVNYFSTTANGANRSNSDNIVTNATKALKLNIKLPTHQGDMGGSGSRGWMA